jgi:hypothetical protein
MGRPEWRHLPAISAVEPSPGQLSNEVKQFFAERLQEMSRFVETLNADDMQFNREWHKVLAAPGELILPQLLTSPTEKEKRAIQPGDVLRLSKTAPITYTFGPDDQDERTFYLYFADKELSVAGEWFDFLETLVRQERFSAESATTWKKNGRSYDWETVRSYLQTMFDQGLLERESTAASA